MYDSVNANGLKTFTSDCVNILVLKKTKLIYEMNSIETCCIEFSKGRLTCFLHSYKNGFSRTLQIEPSFLLDLSHNFQNYRNDVMYSDIYRFA
jgi:hypothetical protein